MTRAVKHAKDAPFEDHHWRSSGSPTYCVDCKVTFPEWRRSEAIGQPIGHSEAPNGAF